MQNENANAKKIRMIGAAIAILIAVVMAVYSFMTLPDMVATQFEGFMNTGAPDVPKLVAVAVPFLVTSVFAVKSVSEPKSIFLCLFGYGVNILFWLSN